MSTPKLTPEFQTQLRELAASCGKSAAKRLVGELGPDLPIDFDDIENFATPLYLRDFSPLRTALRLDEHGCSPRVLKMIAQAMARLHSDTQATYAVWRSSAPASRARRNTGTAQTNPSRSYSCGARSWVKTTDWSKYLDRQPGNPYRNRRSA